MAGVVGVVIPHIFRQPTGHARQNLKNFNVKYRRVSGGKLKAPRTFVMRFERLINRFAAEQHR